MDEASTPGRERSSPLFSEPARCRTMQASAGTGYGLFGGPLRSVRVAAQLVYCTVQLLRYFAAGSLW